MQVPGADIVDFPYLNIPWYPIFVICQGFLSSMPVSITAWRQRIGSFNHFHAFIPKAAPKSSSLFNIFKQEFFIIEST